MKKSILFRVLFYAAGLLILALGLTLNTKTGLGVSPIISVAYSISVIFDYNFGNMTLALYSVFVLIEIRDPGPKRVRGSFARKSKLLNALSTRKMITRW